MTANQETIAKALSGELDGELSARDLRVLEQALGEQPALRDQAAAWADIGRQLGDVSDIPVPDAAAMLARVRRRIEQPAPVRGRRLYFPSPLMAAAAGLLVVVGAAAWFFGAAEAPNRWPTLAAGDGLEPVLWVETYVPDSSAVIYEDEQTGVTVIWMVTDSEAMQGG